jgi:Protein of unknown function (DUF3383)
MAAATLPFSDICQVVVQTNAVAASLPTFNQGLITGISTVIPSYGGTNPRLQQFTSLAGMTTAGFTLSSPEYLAAQLYFGQNPAPQFLWIGRRDLTAIETLIPHSGSAGTNYVVGDVVGITQAGGTFGQATISTVSAGGVPTALAPLSTGQGTGYSIATALATTGGTGTGLTVDITAIGETPLQAIQACRNASGAWWGCMSTSATATDHLAIAAWAQSQVATCYFYTTSDAAVLANTPGNVAGTLQTLLYNRAFGLYSTTQGGLYPSNAYSVAAVLGVVMGLNTGLNNSYFVLPFKPLTGIAPEPVTQSQYTNLNNLNISVYATFGSVYSWAMQGKMPNGSYLDQILGLDMLAADLQISVMNLLASQPAIPLNNFGGSEVITVCDGACGRAADRGFISPGIWNGVQILALTNTTAMPKGWLCQSDNYSKLSVSNRAARIGMPVYVAIILTDAIQSILIGVQVQQ